MKSGFMKVDEAVFFIGDALVHNIKTDTKNK